MLYFLFVQNNKEEYLFYNEITIISMKKRKKVQFKDKLIKL